MRKYLLSGFIVFQRPGDWLPLQEVVTVTDGTFMDEGGLRKFEAYFLEQNNRTYTIASRVAITAFQPLEHRPPVLPRGPFPPPDVLKLLEERASAAIPEAVLAMRHIRPPTFTELMRNNEDIQLNTCDRIMPPVDSPLLIEVAPGVLLKASRLTHAERRDDLLVFELGDGFQYTGRPRWTHP